MLQIFDVIIEKTSGRGIYDITPKLKKWLLKQNFTNGLLTLNIQHTSASLLINENYDPDVLVDLE
ncbi:MAG: YjbQ family protein, partial [Methylophilaceae bacterium]